MKLVMLIDGSNKSFDEIVDVINNKQSILVDTKNCDENKEYWYLDRAINLFSQLDNAEIMLAKFSGKETIVRNLGDEHSEMIIVLSDNKKSRYYTQSPKRTLLDLINIFERETIDGIIRA